MSGCHETFSWVSFSWDILTSVFGDCRDRYPYVSNKASEFLDMSLQIKAFGSDVAFSSVDESLRSYLAPERLEKENQILVEEAKAKLAEGEPESNAKFDAIKGFRLEKIP